VWSVCCALCVCDLCVISLSLSLSLTLCVCVCVCVCPPCVSEAVCRDAIKCVSVRMCACASGRVCGRIVRARWAGRECGVCSA